MKKILTLAIISLLLFSTFSILAPQVKAEIEFIANYGGYGIKGEWETLGNASANLIFENDEAWGWIILGEIVTHLSASKKYVIEKEGEFSTIYEGHLLENGEEVRFAVYRDVIVGEIMIEGTVYSFGIAKTLESGAFVLDQYNEHLYEYALEEGLIEPPVFLFEDSTLPDDRLVIPATVDVDPDTLDLRRTGKWITTYIELPLHPELPEYNVAQIDISTIKLNDQIFAENNQKYGFVRDLNSRIGDYDLDGILDCMVKFNESLVQKILKPGDRVRIEISGSLFDGRPFFGVDFIKVIGEQTSTLNMRDDLENAQSTSPSKDCPLYIQENAVFMSNMDVIPVSHSFVESPEGMPLLEMSPDEKSYTLNINFYVNDSSTAVFIKVFYCNNTMIYHGSVPSSILSVGWNTLTVTLPTPVDGEIHGVRIVAVAGHRDDDGVPPWNGVIDETFGTREEDWNIAFGDGYFVGKVAEDLGWYEYEIAYQFTLKIQGLTSHNPFISSLTITPSKTTLSPGETFTVTAKYYRYSYCPSDYFKFLYKNEATGAISEAGRWAAGYWQMVPYGLQSFTITLTAPSEAGTYTVKAVGCSGHGYWPYYYDVRWDIERSDGGFLGHKPEEMGWDFYEISAKFTITVTLKERIVSVYAVADEEYRDFFDDWWNPWDEDQWKSEVRKAVELGDDNFEKRVGINFVLKEIGTWNSDDSLDSIYALFDEARREVNKGANDVMIAFTNQDVKDAEREGLGKPWWRPPAYIGGTLGLAELLGDDVIVLLVKSELLRFVHQHEYSHLFGAPDHNEEVMCIMSANYNVRVVRLRYTEWCDSCYSVI
ncbi:MAG: M12 family metallo-peptidase, partial [Thermoproteota archaeon]